MKKNRNAQLAEEMAAMARKLMASADEEPKSLEALATEPLRAHVDSVAASNETKAVLMAIQLQTECIIKVMYECVEALNDK